MQFLLGLYIIFADIAHNPSLTAKKKCRNDFFLSVYYTTNTALNRATQSEQTASATEDAAVRIPLQGCVLSALAISALSRFVDLFL